MSGLVTPARAQAPADRLLTGLTAALREFNACRYGRLSGALPYSISVGHAATPPPPRVSARCSPSSPPW
ncbi:hypothetical protein ACRYCC_15065 [Actinomadura scrupuli]|uniref:hypothetical protein n=1 Tax=Actinomadura scrupuli TaxID=559629 RepID=UPI003D97D31E